MRGLTQTERELLTIAAAPITIDVPGTLELRAAGASLREHGRISTVGVCSAATELGRLALRVCPLGEP